MLDTFTLLVAVVAFAGTLCTVLLTLVAFMVRRLLTQFDAVVGIVNTHGATLAVIGAELRHLNERQDRHEQDGGVGT